MQTESSCDSPPRPWWVQPEIAVLTLLVAGIYFSRLTALPIRGEEPRYGTSAAEMLRTGDWVVPRQQGRIFPERPPMSSWAVAGFALLRGEVDPAAIRLPSVVAVLLTSLLIYAYAGLFLSRLGALASALVYATMGQVLQIGRLGESEPLFTLFVSASLMVWHWGYVRRWPAAWTWAAGGGLAALGALVKGIQAPVYFAAVTGLFLLVQRDWRRLLSWQPLAGVAAFFAVLSVWQIPFYLATDWQAVTDTWTGLARDRLKVDGLLSHMASYPLETFACLLPWSPLVVQFASRRFRESIGAARPLLTFVTTALVVTYPSVWLAADARGRYFMPLYPCAALLLGLTIERSVAASAGSAARRGWDRFLLGMAVAAALGGLFVVAVSLIPHPGLATLAQPAGLAILYAVAAAATLPILLWARRAGTGQAAKIALVTIAGFVGLSYTGVVINAKVAGSNDLTPAVAQVKRQLPNPEKLVSLGPVYHRFVYYYKTPIRELDWPTAADEIPEDVVYFCMDQPPATDSPLRPVGRGRSWRMVPRRLPFAWQEIAVVRCGRNRNNKPQRTVVVGRIVPSTPRTAKAAQHQSPSR